jgi:hypothetical protein
MVIRARCVISLAPQPVFSPPAESMPQSTPPAAADQDRLLATAFRSPATIAPFGGLHCEVNAPDLLLRNLPPGYPCPFGSRLHHRLRVAPLASASTSRSRCKFAGQFEKLLFAISTPLRGFLVPSGSKRSIASLPFGPPSGFARSPFAPRHPLFLGQAPDHRSRSVTFPEACCSSNLSEPPSI